MSLIPARWRRPVATTSPEPAPEVGPRAERRSERRSERLTGPRGRVVWIRATGAGRKDDCNHDTEAQAEAHGAREGRVWWPVTIDEGYGEAS